MGFIVNTPVKCWPSGRSDSFYVRVDQASINRINSIMYVVANHYESPESADWYAGDYVEEDGPTTILPVSMSLVDFPTVSSTWSYYHEIPMLQEENLIVSESIVTTEYEEVEYIDFNDDGEEIVATRLVPYEVVTTDTKQVKYNKRKVTLSIF